MKSFSSFVSESKASGDWSHNPMATDPNFKSIPPYLKKKGFTVHSKGKFSTLWYNAKSKLYIVHHKTGEWQAVASPLIHPPTTFFAVYANNYVNGRGKGRNITLYLPVVDQRAPIEKPADVDPYVLESQGRVKQLPKNLKTDMPSSISKKIHPKILAATVAWEQFDSGIRIATTIRINRKGLEVTRKSFKSKGVAIIGEIEHENNIVYIYGIDQD
mgnify:CR=1 FL=1